MSLLRFSTLIGSRAAQQSFQLTPRSMVHRTTPTPTRSFWSSNDGNTDKKTTEERGSKDKKPENGEAKGQQEASKQAGEETTTTTEPHQAAGSAEESEGSGEALSEREVQLTEHNRRLKERLLYAHAEMDNTRRRAQLDVENERTYGISKFGKSLLDVADSLSLALKHSPQPADAAKAHPSDIHTQLALLHEGVVMTEKQLHKVLAQYGIKRFDSRFKKFDPAFHAALFEIPSAATAALPNGPYEAGTVIEVLKEGFTIGDRVLRPADVGVVKKD